MQSYGVGHLTNNTHAVHSANTNDLHPGIIASLSGEDSFNLVPDPQHRTAQNVVSSLAETDGTRQTKCFLFTISFPE